MKFKIGWEGVAGFIYLMLGDCKHGISFRIPVQFAELHD